MSGDLGNIAIFGPGLMGGSLLMALRQRHPGLRLSVWARRQSALDGVMSRGLADFGSLDAAEAARDAGCAVLCLPVERMKNFAKSIADAISPDALVTDVGSVKGAVVAELEEVFSRHANFVGSHPMCGSEEAGLDAARADLYEGATCVITPTSRSRPSLVQNAVRLWEMAGARVVQMDPARHDRAAALVSHVPHIAAAALVELVGTESGDVRELCAGGFRDTTRVASAPADLWSGILALNRREAARGLGGLIALLTSVKQALEEGRLDEVNALLASAAAHRAKILNAPQ